MIVFIDQNFKCHVSNDGTMRAVDIPYFDGKAKALIEGYRYIPPGEAWASPTGKVLQGELLEPWQSYALLQEFQRQHEDAQERQRDLIAALEILGVSGT